MSKIVSSTKLSDLISKNYYLDSTEKILLEFLVKNSRDFEKFRLVPFGIYQIQSLINLQQDKIEFFQTTLMHYLKELEKKEYIKFIDKHSYNSYVHINIDKILEDSQKV